MAQSATPRAAHLPSPPAPSFGSPPLRGLPFYADNHTGRDIRRLAMDTGTRALITNSRSFDHDSWGVRTIPWTSLSDQSLARPILPRTHPAERLLLAALVVENDVLVQQLHERVHGDAIPVPIVEELEAPMYVNLLLSPEISAKHRILPGTGHSSGGRSQRSLPFGIRR